MENKKRLVCLFFFLNENYDRFAKDTWAQIRILLIFRYFSGKSGYFTLSFASDKSHIFQKNSKFGPKITLFVLTWVSTF